MTKKVGLIAVLALMLAAPVAAFSQQNSSRRAMPQRGLERVQEEVRHQLVMLPWLSVFDNLAFKVQPDGTVVLIGQVVHGNLKGDAENVVKKIEGVERVENQIEILPPSPMDDQIRIAEYRAIYGTDGFMKYAIQSIPPIHIIVKNGRVSLEGVVDSQADKDLANIRAREVPNVFEVTNNLKVASK